MKLTTGYDFQGYFITEYLDVIFDEMLVGLGFGKSFVAGLDNIFSILTGTEATEMVDKLNSVKMQLRERVINKARRIGANALIGIDFESSKLGDLIMVSMTATAVKIDKIISPLPYTENEKKQEIEIEKKAKEDEERRQRAEYMREHMGVFDKEIFLKELNNYQTVKEMVEYIHGVAAEYPDIIDESFVLSIREYLQIERLYGKGSGKKDLLNAAKKHLGLC